MQFIKNIVSNLITKIRLTKHWISMDPPVIVIVGATGTGKSKLAIEIAQEFDGEIISADSMQVYKGLDIITNKVTHEERQLAKHYLMDFLDPLSQFSVVDYQKNALKVIEDIHQRKKLPIIVGGTNYYIESLLWKVLLKTNQDASNDSDDMLLYDREKHIINPDFSDENMTKELIFSTPIIASSFNNVSSPKLHKILAEIDPIKANQVHINHKRQIIRCLQVYQQSGKRYSELIAEQKSEEGGSSLGGPLRFTNSCLLWLQCEKNVLNKRLDDRVDSMIEQGLIKEFLDFHDNYNKQRMKENMKPDYTHGIFQSIGFKEFHEYLILSEEEKKSEESKVLLSDGIFAMKVRTRRYSNKQNSWIRNRFIENIDREVPCTFALDGTYLNDWDVNVKEPAFSIVSHYVFGHALPSHISHIPLITKPIHKYNQSGHFHCAYCDRTIVGETQWKIHLSSNNHKKGVKHKRKLFKKYKQLFAILDSHENNLKSRRKSI